MRRPSGMDFRVHPKYITKTLNFGGDSIIVWGFIKRSGLKKNVRVDGIINSAKYTGISEENLVPYIVEGVIFQQDGAPCLHQTLQMHF